MFRRRIKKNIRPTTMDGKRTNNLDLVVRKIVK